MYILSYSRQNTPASISGGMNAAEKGTKRQFSASSFPRPLLQKVNITLFLSGISWYNICIKKPANKKSRLN